MPNIITILAIAIFVVIVLILAEVLHLRNLKNRITKPAPSGRLVVPAPSEIKKSKIAQKREEATSWIKNLGFRTSEQEISRKQITKRIAEKEVKEQEEDRKTRLKKKIDEIEAKIIKRYAKSPETTKDISAIELAKEESEFKAHELEEEQAIEKESPEIYKVKDGEELSADVEKFNQLLIEIYNDINTGNVSDARKNYNELLILYKELSKKVENKDELYQSVKDAREAIISVLR
ncbi:MAG: hypothetical protein Q8R00_05090 [Candidatus Nanoarchaeia archaeon]|nr:hypothetical protein [Candidatus Nanoarchaeia archaeon]